MRCVMKKKKTVSFPDYITGPVLTFFDCLLFRVVVVFFFSLPPAQGQVWNRARDRDVSLRAGDSNASTAALSRFDRVRNFTERVGVM